MNMTPPRQARGATITRRLRTVPRETARAGHPPPVLSCTSWGFSCPGVCTPGGELLPRLFTLTTASVQASSGRFVFCDTVRRRRLAPPVPACCTRHDALWCSDFPLAGNAPVRAARPPAIVCHSGMKLIQRRSVLQRKTVRSLTDQSRACRASRQWCLETCPNRTSPPGPGERPAKMISAHNAPTTGPRNSPMGKKNSPTMPPTIPPSAPHLLAPNRRAPSAPATKSSTCAATQSIDQDVQASATRPHGARLTVK